MVCECGADGKEEEGTGDVLVNEMQAPSKRLEGSYCADYIYEGRRRNSDLEDLFFLVAYLTGDEANVAKNLRRNASFLFTVSQQRAVFVDYRYRVPLSANNCENII